MRTHSRRLPWLTLALGLCACASKSSKAPLGHGVLVIAIDALRADHVSSYGYDRSTTPILDSWAAQGTRFANTFSASPEVQGAHAALLTGGEPALAHRAAGSASDDPIADLADWYVPEGVPRVAQEFLSAGYTTAAFVDHPGISQVYGFGAGFQEFAGFHQQAVLPEMYIGFEGVVSKFLYWIRALDPSQDWFAYVHVDDLERLWEKGGSEPQWDTYFEPRPELSVVPPVGVSEREYFAIPRPRWKGAMRSIGEYEALYDGALKRLDTKLGRLFEGLRGRSRLLNTTVVIVGSYGMGFGEAGLVLDSGTLSDCDLAVPWIVRPAPVLNCPQGVVASELASTMDLAPTLLEISGLRPPANMSGVSHAAALRGKPVPVREFAFASGGLQSGFVAFDARWCYEESSPASGVSASLSKTWYGDALDHSGVVRHFLHDRASSHTVGHLGASAEDPAVAARLSNAGRDWYAAVARATEALQGGAGAIEEVEPNVRADLARRHLLLPAR